VKPINSKYRFERLYAAADAAGKAAADAIVPIPMVVGTPTTVLGSDIDYSKPTYFVEGGVCGFAWISFKGNTAFGRWAKSTGLATKGYPTGLTIRANGYGQSLQRKEAYAQAFAAVLREGGVTAYAESRMD